jgi:hypothetical protein
MATSLSDRKAKPDAQSGAAQHHIASIEVTQHRLNFATPFHASWDTKPRHHWDATLVTVRTDSGLEGHGSGDLRISSSVRIHWRWNAISASCRTSISIMADAGRWISLCGISPARSPLNPAGNCWVDCPRG